MLIADLEAVTEFVGEGHDAEAVRSSWLAAEAYVSERCRWRPVPQVDEDGKSYVVDDEGVEVLGAPDSLVQAVKFQTARYLARRTSPDGTIGMGEFGVARVPITDRDVQDLIAPYRPVVV